jgi:hypothetical protein
MDWYKKISRKDGLSNLPECITYYENELVDARKEFDLKGKSLEHIHSKLPSIFEYRYAQLQEVEAILEYLNIELRRVKSTIFKEYMTKSNRVLSTRDAEKYTEGDRRYVDMAILVNDFALIRNRYLAVSKGLDQVSWQAGHITNLRRAGLDDARLD